MPSAAPSPTVASPDSSEGRGASDSEPPICLRVDVVHEAGDWGSYEASVEAVTEVAEAVIAAPQLEIDRLEACVVLSCDEHSAHLNKTYRGKPAPTNVLSFPASRTHREVNFLGDVVLAQETVAREAKELGLPFKNHLQHLIVHGLLHLLGFDHDNEEDAQTMEAIEISILARLGISNPYELSTSIHETERVKKS